jgi:hypothetical protein
LIEVNGNLKPWKETRVFLESEALKKSGCSGDKNNIFALARKRTQVMCTVTSDYRLPTVKRNKKCRFKFDCKYFESSSVCRVLEP